MHSACVCILSVVLFISDTLLVIVSSTLFLRCGGVCLVDNYSAMETVRQCIQLVCAFCQLCFLLQMHFWSLSHQHCFSVVGVFLCCGGVSLLWGCLSCRQLFSHGNSEVMHSACVCILSIVLFISDTLLVIVSSTLFLCCGGVCLVDNYSAMETVMHSACVCILSIVLSS